MRTIYANQCSCGKYTTAYDFDSFEIADTAARLHIMLPGEHTVIIKQRQGCIISVAGEVSNKENTDVPKV